MHCAPRSMRFLAAAKAHWRSGKDVDEVARQSRAGDLPARNSSMIEFDFMAVLVQWPLLLRGAAFTLAADCYLGGHRRALGIACAWARAWGPRQLRALVATYVELIRNTPFIVQLFFIFLGYPRWGCA